MSLISTAELAGRTGYTKRQIQRMAAAGEVPSTRRTAGGHWRIEETPALAAWCKEVRNKRRVVSRSEVQSAGKRGRDNYVPHLTRLLTVLRRTAPRMSEDQRNALRADLDILDEIRDHL